MSSFRTRHREAYAAEDALSFMPCPLLWTLATANPCQHPGFETTLNNVGVLPPRSASFQACRFQLTTTEHRFPA
eukprot:1590432-Rhodomonas_salina.2